MTPTSIPHYKGKLEISPFTFECGKTLERVTIVYETWGRPNAHCNNVVLIEHALTGTSHATSSCAMPEVGWWEYLIGPGRAINTEKYFVICSNVLGGCSGSTGPASIDERTGLPYGLTFPTVTVRDMVHSQKFLIDHLGIQKILLITGASMGGMQAMEWAALYPELVEAIAPISAPGRAYPQSIAYRKAQRKAIMMDPCWQGGQYYGNSHPEKGIELARMIGFISYRTELEFAQRFGRNLYDPSLYEINSRFEIESYLEYHGQKLAKWFDANSYLYLSKVMDLHDMGWGRPSYEAGIQSIQAKVRMIGINSDILFPAYQQQEIVRILNKTNSNAEYKEVNSIYGHDAFLVEQEQVSQLMDEFLRSLINGVS